jgi:hypothetical protein
MPARHGFVSYSQKKRRALPASKDATTVASPLLFGGDHGFVVERGVHGVPRQ